MNTLGVIAVVLAMTISVSLPASASRQNQSSKADSDGAEKTSLKVVGYPGQIIKLQVESPDSSSTVKAVNKATSPMDVDFIAFDTEGNEVAHETVVVGPKLKTRINLQGLFPQLLISDLSNIQVQSSVRPLESGATVPQALQLAVAFFSQRDPRWSGNRLGTCATTIGQQGCLVSCIAMAGARSVSNFNPASLNTYLTNNRGYSNGCLVIHSVAANVDGLGGFTFLGTGSVTSAANLKSLIDSSKFPIAKSARSSTHFGVIIGYNGLGTRLSDFYYLDPWDTTAVFRTVGDGWVTSSSTTRVYQ